MGCPSAMRGDSPSKTGRARAKMNGPGQAITSRPGMCGQQVATNLYTKVQVHVECNSTSWQ